MAAEEIRWQCTNVHDVIQHRSKHNVVALRIVHHGSYCDIAIHSSNEKKVNTNDATMIPCAYALDTENKERHPKKTEMKIAHLWLSKNEQYDIAVVSMMTMMMKEK